MWPDRSVWLHFGSVSHVLPFRTEREVKAWAAERERELGVVFKPLGLGAFTQKFGF